MASVLGCVPAATLQVSNTHDAADSLSRIDAPTLVLHGTDDRMAQPENAQLLAARIHGATRRLIPGGRHGFFDECREQLAALIRTHLN